ncbi:MAG: HAD-IA family hydrolase [Thermoleophilia bacterium]|nr:HAD-IA family hydrolase [Thermoleophilia bacterium]
MDGPASQRRPGTERVSAAYKAVVFDLDGTLVDSVELIIISFQHAIRQVLGREISREESIVWVGRPLREQMAHFSPEHAEELVDVYREFNHREHDRMLKLYDGILNLLDALLKARVKLGLVTSKSRYTTQMAFDLTGIESYFDASVCADESPGNKPSPEPISTCLERLGVDPAEAAYVGDSPSDIQAALAAGVRAIGVTWGVFDAEALEAEKPDILVHTIPELAEVLGI